MKKNSNRLLSILVVVGIFMSLFSTAILPTLAVDEQYMVHIKTTGGDGRQTFAIPLKVTGGKTYTFSFKSTAQVMTTNSGYTTITKNGVFSQTVNATDYNITFDYDSDTGINTAKFTVPAGVTKVYANLDGNYYNDNAGIYMADFELIEEGKTENLFDTKFSKKLEDWRIGTNYNNDGAVGTSSNTTLTLERKDNDKDESTTLKLMPYDANAFPEEDNDDDGTDAYMVHIKTTGGDGRQTFAIPLKVTGGKTYTFSFKSTAQVMTTNSGYTTITKNGVFSQTVNATDYNITFDYDSDTGINTAKFTVPAGVTKVYANLDGNYYNDNAGIYMADFELIEEGKTENLFDTKFSKKLEDWRIGTNYNNDGAVGTSKNTVLTLERKDNDKDESTTLKLMPYDANVFPEDDNDDDGTDAYMVHIKTTGGDGRQTFAIPLKVTGGKTYTFSFKSTAQVMTTNSGYTTITKNGVFSQTVNATDYNITFDYDDLSGVNTAKFTVPAGVTKVYANLDGNYYNDDAGIYMADFELVEEGETENLFNTKFSKKLEDWRIGTNYNNDGAVGTSKNTVLTLERKDNDKDESTTLELMPYDDTAFKVDLGFDYDKYMVKVSGVKGNYPSINIPLRVTAGKTYTFSFKSTSQVMKTNNGNTRVCKNGPQSGTFNNGSTSTYSSVTGINSLTFSVPLDAGSTVWFGMNQDYSNSGAGIYMADFELVEEGKKENLFNEKFTIGLGGWAIDAGAVAAGRGATSISYIDGDKTTKVELMQYDGAMFGEVDSDVKYMVKAKTSGGDLKNSICIPLTVDPGKTYIFSFRSTEQVMTKKSDDTCVCWNGSWSQRFTGGSEFDYNEDTGINTVTFTVPTLETMSKVKGASWTGKVWVCMLQNFNNNDRGIYMTDFKFYEKGNTATNIFKDNFPFGLGSWEIGPDYDNGSGPQANGITSFSNTRNGVTLQVDLLEYNEAVFKDDFGPVYDKYMVKANTSGGNLKYSICIPLNVTAGKTYTFSFKSTEQVMTKNKDNTGICWNGSWSQRFTNGSEFDYNEDTGINTVTFTVPTLEAMSKVKGASWTGKVWVCMLQNFNNNDRGIYMTDFKLYEGKNTSKNLFDDKFSKQLRGWEIGASYDGGVSASKGTTSFKGTSKNGVTLKVDLLEYNETVFKEDFGPVYDKYMVKVMTDNVGNKKWSVCIPLPAEAGKTYTFSFESTAQVMTNNTAVTALCYKGSWSGKFSIGTEFVYNADNDINSVTFTVPKDANQGKVWLCMEQNYNNNDKGIYMTDFKLFEGNDTVHNLFNFNKMLRGWEIGASYNDDGRTAPKGAKSLKGTSINGITMIIELLPYDKELFTSLQLPKVVYDDDWWKALNVSDEEYVAKGTVKGTLRSENGKALRGKKLHLVSDSTDWTGDIVTDKNGKFVFKNVPIGESEISYITEDGATIDFTDEFIELINQNDVVELDLILSGNVTSIQGAILYIVIAGVIVACGVSAIIIIVCKKKAKINFN